MTRDRIAGGALAVVLLLLLALSAGYWVLELRGVPAPATPPEPPATEAHPASESGEGFLYGRITTTDGDTYEGRLRWGGAEEAFWGDYFNGTKDDNPWVDDAPSDATTERRSIEIFGLGTADSERPIDLRRPFMARFGDIARIEPRGRDLLVTLKSGTVFDLDLSAADDLGDGVRVWDDRQGVRDLDERQIRALELLPTPSPGAAPYRVQGTVRTAQGEFTGFVQWNREKGVGTDVLEGDTPDGRLGLRFDTIRSIERDSGGQALVTLLDGREFVLSGTREAGRGHLGVYVDDPRYGRVLISWGAFQRVDFGPGDSGPAYGDFPAGQPLTGRVTTRGGDRLTGRLVFDLDESETTETLDAPSEGVDYTVPFGLIASIVVPPDGEENGVARATVTLHGGEELRLERRGDLGAGNAGMLIFVESRERPQYVPWTDVARIDLDRPPATYPPLD